MNDDYAAVILTGGAGSRLGGVDKPMLPVAGVPMVQRVLAAVADATVTVVVGPAGLPVPPEVRVVRERPPGGGPVAALAAAMLTEERSRPDAVEDRTWPSLTVILAGDLPLLTSGAIGRLRDSIGDHDGAVYVDADGRRQWLCGIWRSEPVRASLRALPETANQSLRRLFADFDVATIRVSDDPPPWFDCDTDDDLRRAEEWLRR